MAMRRRRGNYTILFVLAGTVLLSYLAFSIDGGRIQVAKLDGANAAEAAALAAMMTIREGGNEDDAAVAAGVAANKVSFGGLSTTGNAAVAGVEGQTFDLTIDWGRWNWESARTTLDSRWDLRRDGLMPQAVTVNVKTSGTGLRTMFGSIVGIAGNDPTTAKSFGTLQVGAGVRAAFRNRDIVVVVDTSRFDEVHIDGIQTGLQAFLDSLADNGVPGDTIALVAYAGGAWNYDLRDPDALEGGDPSQLNVAFTPAQPNNPFVSVRRDRDVARATMDRVEPCNVGSDAFLHAYRHTLMGQDLELAAPFVDYYAIEPRPANATTEGQFFWAWDTSPNSIQTLMLAYGRTAETFNQGNWGRSLSLPDQCAVWFFVESFPFLTMDPRRDRLVNASGGMRSPLQCHTGSPYVGRSDSVRFDVDTPIPSIDCGFPVIPETGEERYVSPVNAPVMYMDRSYFQAGSNPGPGLNLARELLGNRNTNGEPTVVLISGTYPRCGPNVLPSDIPDCDGIFLSDTSAALESLDGDKVTTHVVSIAPAGSLTDVQLSTFTTGRGIYSRVARGDQVAGALLDVAKDLRVQVVR